jgi:hypothetical protein
MKVRLPITLAVALSLLLVPAAARAATTYTFSKKTKLKAGYYAMFVRGTDNPGHVSTTLSAAAKTVSVFRLK